LAALNERCAPAEDGSGGQPAATRDTAALGKKMQKKRREWTELSMIPKRLDTLV
jgi:hypothetical protein